MGMDGIDRIDMADTVYCILYRAGGARFCLEGF